MLEEIQYYSTKYMLREIIKAYTGYSTQSESLKVGTQFFEYKDKNRQLFLFLLHWISVSLYREYDINLYPDDYLGINAFSRSQLTPLILKLQTLTIPQLFDKLRIFYIYKQHRETSLYSYLFYPEW
jgi:hypothetical protein